MRAPRQSVDDGNGGVRGKLEQRLVVQNADHDGVDIARQHPRRVGDGLAAAELHLGAGQHDRLAAELAHADVERHAGARRRPFEDHRQGLAFERLLIFRISFFLRLQLRLHGGAGVEHVAQLDKRQFADIEKMTDGLAHHPAAFFNGAPDSATQARSSICTDCSISDSLTINGARKRTTLSPAPTVSNFWSRSALTRSPEGTTALTPTSSPSPRTSDTTFG